MNPNAAGSSDPVHRILQKPGRFWSKEERNCIYEWLFEEHQLRELLTFCRFHLGNPTLPSNAEDAWMEFTLSQLDDVVRSYNPARGCNFTPYLHLCLKRWCWDRGEEIRKRGDRERSLDMEHETLDGSLIPVELPDTAESPSVRLEKKEFLKALNEAWLKLHQKNPKHAEAFRLYYVDGESFPEIAECLDAIEPTVRVWVYRAAQELRKSLRKKGWPV